MHRFFADKTGLVGDFAILDAEDARHALKVLRLQSGDEICLIANGGLHLAQIDELGQQQIRVKRLSSLPSSEPRLKVTLFQGLPKADKMDFIVQKSTELGVHRIVPVMMERCIAKVDDKDAVKKRERWQKIAREAAKQSGRCAVPEVALPASIHACDFSADLMLCPWEEARGYSLKKAAEERPWAASVSLLIGPEGGISPHEMARLPLHPITLGSRILRTETAGLCALSVLFALYGDMEGPHS